MSKSSDLSNKRSIYYAFKENINNTASQKKSIVDELDSPIKSIVETYIIDEDSGDKYKLKRIQAELKEKYNLLITQTIPAIETKISSITKEIEAAIREEEEARKLAEEAARKEKAREYNGKN